MIDRNEATPLDELREWIIKVTPAFVAADPSAAAELRRGEALAWHCLKTLAPRALDAAGLIDVARQLREIPREIPRGSSLAAATTVARSAILAAGNVVAARNAVRAAVRAAMGAAAARWMVAVRAAASAAVMGATMGATAVVREELRLRYLDELIEVAFAA
jgi:hypothetical protein